MRYAVKIVKDGGAYVATCRDLPAFNSVGDSLAEALQESIDAIALVLQWHMDHREPLPRPSDKKRGEFWVSLPALDVAKIGLYEAMRSRGLRKSSLARKLGVHAPQVDRLLSLTHKSKLDQVEAALAVLGYRVNVSVEPFDGRRAA
ncbi:MAG TPA: type II toxin-antitoxin system HicB family antitoxin [Pinirhizobacter sp.]|uniref:type II toxin-antitoxin system HicB family antitoxin n=1 Tax=Pinirhizobacter sp. TaxID=2950432 RepID=UPI002CE99BF7|nr:type II toxin-antitoxin system HicB family antitoxin [Pinirhizobacter sp.]HMH67243.1 type II toxin-antitoxin system HicB family antitoxin [Pinirhizobacter sp.]